jgi:hypothetical protein
MSALGFVPLWLIVRFGMPNKGQRARRTSSPPGGLALLIAILSGFGVLPFLRFFQTLETNLSTILAAIGLVLLSLTPAAIVFAWYAPARKKWLEDRQAEAVAEWDGTG